jgi:hypothetical protein
MIHIDPTHLSDRDQRQARYLAALSEYRALAAEFAATMQRDGQADASAVEAASQRLHAVADDPAFIRDQMRPVREVAEMTGLSVALVRRLANGNHALSDQVRSEQRFGKLWYVLPDDVEMLVESEEIVPRNRSRTLVVTLTDDAEDVLQAFPFLDDQHIAEDYGDGVVKITLGSRDDTTAAQELYLDTSDDVVEYHVE